MAEEKKKSQVEDINRSIYDVKDKVEYSYKADKGLTEDVIREISREKDEPEWMLEKRLKALEIYNKLDVPPWAPDISELDMEHIDTYVRPKTDMKARWEDLPEWPQMLLRALIFRLSVHVLHPRSTDEALPGLTRTASLVRMAL